jgi:hypothetical protein
VKIAGDGDERTEMNFLLPLSPWLTLQTHRRPAKNKFVGEKWWALAEQRRMKSCEAVKQKV